jgi:DNA-binding transcriptional LysR family regulator
MALELRLLHYFVTLAEELHFSRAAQRLCITQPPLSVAIKQLEDGLQAQLFERSSKGVRLTPAGEHLLGKARQLLALSDQAALETRDVARGTRGHLRLGFVGSSLYRGLPQALAQLQQSHPQVRVDMLEANSAEQIQGLLQMRLDVALVHSIQPPEGIASQLIVEEPFVACLPEGHRLCACEAIDLSALQGDRLILFSNLVSPTYHQRIYEMCLAHGFAPEVRHEVRHWLSVISMVSLGQGVALVPAALERVGLPRLAFRPLRGTHPSSEMLAMWRRAPANPLVQALLAHLRAAAGAMAAAA